MKVKIIENLAPFVTVNGELYTLKKGDVVELPKVNADLLLTHGVAVLSKGKVTAKSNVITASTNKRDSAKCYKLSEREKWLLEGNYKIIVGKHKIPSFMTLQKELTTKGGQMHFRNGGPKKQPKSITKEKTKRRVKKGSDNLMTFGIKLPDVKTLEDMLR